MSASVSPAKAIPSGALPKPQRTPGKTPARSREAKIKGVAISEQQLRNYVEVAAYYIAERRGFQYGSALEDWAQAEREVDRLLRENHLSS